VIKLPKLRCLECSSWDIFLSGLFIEIIRMGIHIYQTHTRLNLLEDKALDFVQSEEDS
jgi:hypothetical protein